MKNLIIIIACLLASAGLQAQEKNQSKIVETQFEVSGVCNMCKERIETAALRTKGVKQAVWDKNSKMLSIIYNSEKTDLKSIQSAVLEKGHDIKGQEADSSNYAKLPDCCAYRNPDLKTH